MHRWQGVFWGSRWGWNCEALSLLEQSLLFRYRASCLFPLSNALWQKFFELDAQFVRLKGRTGCLGQQLDLICSQLLYRWYQVVPADRSGRRFTLCVLIWFLGHFLMFQSLPALPTGEQSYPEAAQADHSVAGHHKRGPRPLPFHQPRHSGAGQRTDGAAY